MSYLAARLKGSSGLLFTNLEVSEVQKYVGQYSADEYAVAGNVATRTIVLEKGEKNLTGMCHSMAPYLRTLGLNVKLDNQKLVLCDNFILAEHGKTLTVERCKLLKLLKIKMGQFRVQLVGVWEKDTKSVQFYD